MKNLRTLIALIVLLSFIQCKRDDDLYAIGSNGGVKVSNIISFKSISSDSVEADSATLCIFSIQLNPATDSSNRMVVFRTSIGKFQNGMNIDTVAADAYGIVTVSMVDNTIGKALVSATARSYSVDTSVIFTPALPDDLILSGSKFTGVVSDSFNFSCNLYRNPGKGVVSDPIKVFFSVTQDSSNIISQNLFLPPFAYSAGHSLAFTVKNPYQKTGYYRVHAKTQSTRGDSLDRYVGLIIN